MEKKGGDQSCFLSVTMCKRNTSDQAKACEYNHGPSPLIDFGQPANKYVPQGRSDCLNDGEETRRRVWRPYQIISKRLNQSTQRSNNNTAIPIS